MSKIAIIVCTVLLATAAKVDSQLDTTEIIINNALGEISAAISRLEEEIKTSEKIISDESVFFAEKKRELLVKSFTEASTKTQNTRRGISHITFLFTGIDIRTCLEASDSMIQRIENAQSITDECIMNKIDSANLYIEMTDVKSYDALAKLAVLKRKIQQNIDNIDGQANNNTLGASPTEISTEAGQLSDSAMSDLKVKISEFKLKIEDIKSTLNTCSFKTALNQFSMEWSAIIKKMSTCIGKQVPPGHNLLGSMSAALKLRSQAKSSTEQPK